MLLSNPKIDYSSVPRMPIIKLSGQTQGTTSTALTNSMPTSTSLQDISAHHAQQFTWNNDSNDEKNEHMINFSKKILPSNGSRHLSTSHSDERIFEHPEVTIKPSALDDEIQRRLLTLKPSITNENLLERDDRNSVPNVLEHPDMRSPVVMQGQPIPSSTSSSALLIQKECKRVSRTQSADVYTTRARTPSPGNRVEFFIDNQQNSKRSTSPGSYITDIVESPEQEQNEDLRSPSSTAVSTCEYSQASSKSDHSSLKTKKNDSW